jgi:hypothetical protein
MLAEANEPVLLYEAPSHTWMLIASGVTGLFFATYAAYHYMVIVYNPPAGLASWVPHAFGAVVVAGGFAGAWFIMGTMGM